MDGLRVLLIEAWAHGSHRRWAEGYRRASRHRVDLLTRPAGSWRWLLRAGAAGVADQVASHVDRSGPPDVVLVSGTVDVAQVLGIARRSLPAEVPVVVYQHESQIVYPAHRPDTGEAAVRDLASWTAADLVLFNSEHHRAAVVAALPDFVGRWPAGTPSPDLDRLVERFEVLPVGVDLDPWAAAARQTRSERERGESGPGGGRPPVVLWPHRWERDKDPEAFGRAVAKLARSGMRFHLVLAGEDPPGGNRYAEAARSAVAAAGDRVLALGPFDEARYRQLLAEADIVVSCAHHEFFGVAVVEAIAAGCRPVLPNGLAYPEVVPPAWHDRALYPPGRFGTALAAAIDEVASRADPDRSTDDLARAMDRFDWSEVAPRYDDRLQRLASGAGR